MHFSKSKFELRTINIVGNVCWSLISVTHSLIHKIHFESSMSHLQFFLIWENALTIKELSVYVQERDDEVQGSSSEIH